MLEYIDSASTVKRRAPWGRPLGNESFSCVCKVLESRMYVGSIVLTIVFSL